MHYRRHSALYVCSSNKQRKALVIQQLILNTDFIQCKHLGYFSFLEINIGSRETDLEVNTTHICKIIADY